LHNFEPRELKMNVQAGLWGVPERTLLVSGARVSASVGSVNRFNLAL
jgi:hypothetical protein